MRAVKKMLRALARDKRNCVNEGNVVIHASSPSLSENDMSDSLIAPAPLSLVRSLVVNNNIW